MKQKTPLIIFNGPAGCGKDFLAKELMAMIPGACVQCECKEQLRLDTIKLFMSSLEPLSGPNLSPADVALTLFENRDLKEKPHAAFGGMSPREALIFTSENVYKKMYGVNHYAKELVKQIIRKAGGGAVPIITDCRFTEELVTVYNALRDDYEIHVVHVSRAGVAYSDVPDSVQNYLPAVSGVHYRALTNRDTMLYQNVGCLADIVMNYMGDKYAS